MSLIEHARGFVNGIRGDAGVGADDTETETAESHEVVADEERDDDVAALVAEWSAQPHH